MKERRARYLRIASVAMLAPLVILLATLVTKRYQRQSDGAARINDSVQFWCAGNLIRQGMSPYDVAGQTAISREVGWDRDGIGAGRYDFMPFYYPYWIAAASAPLTCLSFADFTALWSVVQFLAACLAALILCRIPGRGYEAIAFALVMVFPLVRQVADMGQIANFVLLGVAALWWSCERRYDATAGILLALLCSKPQLGLFVVPCVVVWSMRHGRFRIAVGCVGGIAALVAISTLCRPEWLMECLAAPRRTPMVTGENPSLVTTWYAVLKTVGLPPIAIVFVYAAAAIPAAIGCAAVAWRRSSEVADVIGLSMMMLWFAVPYMRSYDLVVLMFPVMVLIGKAGDSMRPALLFIFGVIPILHQVIRWRRDEFEIAGLEIWWSWMPVVCALVTAIALCASRLSRAGESHLSAPRGLHSPAARGG